MTMRWLGIMFGLIFFCDQAAADLNSVYQPYVNQGEREVEFAMLGLDFRRPVYLRRLSIAYSWNDDISTEIYLLADSERTGGRVRGQEVELKWQLTEQGEYWADWGLIFEYERSTDLAEREVAIGVLIEKELAQRWVASLNGLVEYEFNGATDNEFENALHGRIRYLHSMTLEPALELHLDDEDYAAGPAMLGAYRLAPGRALRWDIGVLFGLKNRSPDQSLRIAFELEF